MEDHKVKATVLSSECPRYKAGDEIFFDGAFIDTEKSAALCMVALNAIYPFAYAARRGGSVRRSVRDACRKARLRIGIFEE